MGAIFRVIAWWRNASNTVRLVSVNLAVFVAVTLAAYICLWSGAGPDAVYQWVEMPTEPMLLLTRPWTIATYMVTHLNFFHILFNLLWLYWIGSLVERVYGPRKLLALYALGGLVAAVVFFVTINALGGMSWLVGASASVLAILAAAAILMPNQTFLMLLFGPVKLKWIAIVAIALYVAVQAVDSWPTALAHLSGILTGMAVAMYLKAPHKMRPRRLGRWKLEWGDSSTSSQPIAPPKKNDEFSPADQEQLDAMLDKIKRSGYASLTAEEKRKLFRLSRRIH